MKRFKTVDEYMAGHEEWQPLLNTLRDLLNSTSMEETVKWGSPTYTVNGKNVVGLAAFKEFVSIWFHQGVFLKDEHKKLLNAQEGVTKGLRQWRMHNMDELEAELLLTYVNEAISNQKAGKEIKVDRSKPVNIPQELQDALANDPALHKAFEAMTKGKQREYADHVGEAKREETRLKRLEKVIPMILAGKGLNDRYRK